MNSCVDPKVVKSVLRGLLLDNPEVTSQLPLEPNVAKDASDILRFMLTKSMNRHKTDPHSGRFAIEEGNRSPAHILIHRYDSFNEKTKTASLSLIPLDLQKELQQVQNDLDY